MIAWSYGGGDVLARFRSSVIVAGDEQCWLWTGKPNAKGYGRFTVNYKTVMAHVASYVFAFGSIPDGLCVLHRCDVPACVNPAHLFVGTRTVNNADMRAKGRGVNPPVGVNSGTWNSEKIRGRKHPRAKLTQRQLDELLGLARGGSSTVTLAEKFRLTIRHVNKLRRDAGATSRGKL